MKTFTEAFDSLVSMEDGLTKDSMDKYIEVATEVANSDRCQWVADYCKKQMESGRLSLDRSLRFAFSHGVLTGVEMEKIDA